MQTDPEEDLDRIADAGSDGDFAVVRWRGGVRQATVSHGKNQREAAVKTDEKTGLQQPGAHYGRAAP